MAELVEEFNLVGFVTLAVEDKDSMAGVLTLVDKANGALPCAHVSVVYVGKSQSCMV